MHGAASKGYAVAHDGSVPGYADFETGLALDDAEVRGVFARRLAADAVWIRLIAAVGRSISTSASGASTIGSWRLLSKTTARPLASFRQRRGTFDQAGKFIINFSIEKSRVKLPHGRCVIVDSQPAMRWPVACPVRAVQIDRCDLPDIQTTERPLPRRDQCGPQVAWH